MKKIVTTAAVIMALGFGAAKAEEHLLHNEVYRAKPKPVAAFSVAAKRVEMLAVTRRARADTPLRRAHLHESRNMSKVIPGYPQPAFVTIDFRIKF